MFVCILKSITNIQGIYKELKQSLLAELHKLNLLVPVNSDLLLYGNKDLSLDCNLHSQELVSNYTL